MVSSRRTRLLIIVAISLTVGLFFFGLHSQKNISKLLGSIDEAARLGVDQRGPGLIKNSYKADSGEAAGRPGSNDVNVVDHGANAPHDLTTDPGKPFDAEKEYHAVLSEAPVVIFSKSYCPHSKYVKNLLQNEYQIVPSPIVVELDMHPHGSILQDYIGDMTGRRTVPNVHILGITRGGGDDFRKLHEENKLASAVQEWGGSKLRIKKNALP